MATMVSLGEDLLVDILSCLPTADLCRCRCVSNHWRRRLVPLILAQRPNLPLTGNTLVNVLSRLPPADLCRCKCVCKDWRRRLIPHATSLRPNLALVNFIQSPTFISFSEDDGSVHNDRSLPSPSLCSSLFEDEEGAARFLGVCNGMAFASRGWAYQQSRYGSWHLPRHPFCHYFNVTRYVLLNPLTGQVSTIPPPPPPDASPEGFNFLAFDPRSSSVHYKIISVKLSDAHHGTPYLYSSLTREWRPLDLCEEKSSTPHRVDPYRMDPHPQQSYCLDGVAYRFAGDSDTPTPGYAQKNIMALDVKGRTPVLDYLSHGSQGQQRDRSLARRVRRLPSLCFPCYW